jgi:multidrug efflux pump subunit AcrA (membrane-fusion protein)
MKKYLVLYYFLIGSLLIAGCGKSKEATQEAHHEEEGRVHLKEASQKMIGLEIVQVQKKPLFTWLQVAGEIAPETENVFHLTPPEPGVLKSFSKQIGETVEKDTPLCVIQTKTGEALELKSPAHGIVMSCYVKPGDSVDTLTSITTIADPDLLRVSFNIYEKDLAGIKLDQKVMVESVAYPSKEFEGKIVFISPSIDSTTRTIKIRVDVNNPEHLLKFGMYVTGKIKIPLAQRALVIPESAVQEIKGEQVVFVPKEGEPEEFLIKEIKTGQKSEEAVEITEGIQEGARIVGKGSFYLKAELLKGELEEGHAD